MQERVCFGLLLTASLLVLLLTNAHRFRSPDTALIHSARLVMDPLDCACAIERPLPDVTVEWASTCGDWATARGPHQRVVAYAFFGNESLYFRGIALNAQLVREMYPGWRMRVYYYFWNLREEQVRDTLCPLWCDYPHVDFCPVDRLPFPLGDQTSLQPRMWRFLVLGDPLVDRFVSRDLDSLISQRELSAVDEWVASGKTFHFMRDHFLHNDPIAAGMWGAVNTDSQLTTRLRKKLVAEGQRKQHKFQDQYLLRDILLPVAEHSGDYVNHVSYHCQALSPRKSRPWPTRRNQDGDFVGNPVLRVHLKLVKPCPKKCRPKTHKDWTFC